jgi:hypothetical protein
MPNYEYRTEVLTHGLLGRNEDELDRSELDERLNALGADGWEFEKLLTRLALHGEKDGHLLIFRARARDDGSALIVRQRGQRTVSPSPSSLAPSRSRTTIMITAL